MSTATRPQPSPSAQSENPSAQPAPFSDLLTPRSTIPTPFPIEWIPFTAPATSALASDSAYTTSALPSPTLAHLATPSSPSALPYLSLHPSTGTLNSFNSSHAPSVASFPADYPFLAHPWEGSSAPNHHPSSTSGRGADEQPRSRNRSSSGGKTLRRLSSAILRPRRGGEELAFGQREAMGAEGSSSRGRDAASSYLELPDPVKTCEGGEWQRQVRQWERAERAKGFETTDQMVQMD